MTTIISMSIHQNFLLMNLTAIRTPTLQFTFTSILTVSNSLS
ncbi:MAG: hypothetical protein SFY66_06420 [Oculatellaceae cyanobacterium bins.114]|nr:hypothetical protein [Oculatellaceae cyanobacterium bins.114]